MTSPETNRILLGLLLGVTAAGANVLGGSLIAHGQWSRRYLKYFIALGAGFMLATALLEMIPESLKLRGDHESFFFHDTSSVFLLVLAGYFLVHFFEHTLAPHFHFGEETHHEEISHAHASYAALLGLGIHTLFDGVAIASGLLVSTSLGILIFLAIFLHKLPEGFTVASLMLASGQSRRALQASKRCSWWRSLPWRGNPPACQYRFRPTPRSCRSRPWARGRRCGGLHASGAS